jgi:hypothetical protein
MAFAQDHNTELGGREAGSRGLSDRSQTRQPYVKSLTSESRRANAPQTRGSDPGGKT